MRELFLNGLTIAYVCAGVICCVAYLPTIKDLYFHKKASANTTTYILWTITAFITLLYSFFVLPDLLFRIISAANFIACALVLFLSATTSKAKQIDLHQIIEK